MGKILLILFIMADSTTPGLGGSNRFRFLLFNSLRSNAMVEPQSRLGGSVGSNHLLGDCSMAHLVWRRSSDFLKQAMQVRDNPALHQLTTLHPVDGDALERDSPACGSDATEVTLVCSKQSPPHHHPVTFRNEIIDFISGVR
jgi:hypothetical protein